MAKFKVGDIWKSKVLFDSKIGCGDHILIQKITFVPFKKYMAYHLDVIVLEKGVQDIVYTDSRHYNGHFEKVETDVEPV